MDNDNESGELYSLGGEELRVDLQQKGSALKSILDHLGTDDQTGYSVRYQRLAEVHGAWDPSHPDSASLVALKITPRVDNYKDRFKMLSITITVVLPKGTIGNLDAPYFDSYEPGEGGAWFMDEVSTTRTVTKEAEGTLSGQVPSGPELALKLAQAVSEESKIRFIHKIETTEGWVAGVSVKRTNQLKWTITPAENSNGIGDHIVIAFLVRRARASKFRLKIDHDANISYFTDKWNDRPWGNKFRLGDFGPAKSPTQVKPAGVSEGNLKQVSDTKLLGKIAYIHVPEKVVPRTNYSSGKRALLHLS